MPKKFEFSDTIAGSMKKAAADTQSDNIKMIDVDNLIESPDNFFELSRIEELAETILGQGGVKENLIVEPLGNDKYEIISGHRRTSAVRHLLERGENISRYLPCLVQNYESEDDKHLDLILMNITARTLTDAQLWKSYEVLNEIFQKKKQLGEKFGKIQQKLAEMLGVSHGQVGNMQMIDKKAIPEVKAALENGEVSINTAKAIAELDEDEQKDLVAEKPLSKVKPKDVAKKKPTEKSTKLGTFSDDGKTEEDLSSEKEEPDVVKKSTKLGTFSDEGETEEDLSAEKEEPDVVEKSTKLGTFSDDGKTEKALSAEKEESDVVEKSTKLGTFSDDGETEEDLSAEKEESDVVEKSTKLGTFSNDEELIEIWAKMYFDKYEKIDASLEKEKRDEDINVLLDALRIRLRMGR